MDQDVSPPTPNSCACASVATSNVLITRVGLMHRSYRCLSPYLDRFIFSHLSYMA